MKICLPLTNTYFLIIVKLLNVYSATELNVTNIFLDKFNEITILMLVF